jgi:hypothetical protein
LLVGKYSEKIVSQWGQDIHVYPTPNTRPNRGPKLLMKVERLVHSGRRELKFVRYGDDVATNGIILEPLFKVQDVEEFEAAVK